MPAGTGPKQFCSVLRNVQTEPATHYSSYSIGDRGGYFSEEKRLGCIADTHIHLVPGVRNDWSYTSAPPMCLHDVHRDLTF